jgi:hypothetical protein
VTNRIIIFVIAAMLVSACGTTKYQAKAQKLDPDDLPKFAVRGTVTVSGMTANRYKLLHPMASLEVNYQDMTSVAVTALQAELNARPSETAGDEEKSLNLQITDVSMVGIWTCYINFNIATGDGYLHGHQVESGSWNFTKACHEAVTGMVIATVSDPEVQDYLAR